MATESVEVVVIGAGQSGVCLSYFLQKRGVRHLVLEKATAFSAWEQRWDSFRMNTPNWMNEIPGAPQRFAPGSGRSEIGTGADALEYFGAYLSSVGPPLREHTEVTRVRQLAGGLWSVETPETTYECRGVAICTNPYPAAKIPDVAGDLSSGVVQVHSSEFRNAQQIAPGPVLVVGSGSSGVQICEDLARSGRFSEVYLAVSGNGTLPWKVAGVPTYTLLRFFGMLGLRRGSLRGRVLQRMFSGREGDFSTPPKPEELRRRYVVRLVGKVAAVHDGALQCDDGASVPMDGLTVVWATGFKASYDFIEVGNSGTLLDDHGDVLHDRGVSFAAPGLCFVGLRFQSTVASRFINGVGRDAEYVASHLATLVKAETTAVRC